MTATTTQATTVLHRARAAKVSFKEDGCSAPEGIALTVAARKSVRRAAAASREGVLPCAPPVASTSAKPTPTFQAPQNIICGPMYIPWETCEPPSLCCGTKAFLAKVVASRAARSTAGETALIHVAAVAPPLSAPKGTRPSRGLPPLLSPAGSSAASIPSPLSTEPIDESSQPDFFASLTHLAYPSPASSTTTPPATHALEPDFTMSSSLSEYSPPDHTGDFDEDLLTGQFDLSTFSRRSSPTSIFELKMEEEDLAIVPQVKHEDTESCWGSVKPETWSW